MMYRKVSMEISTALALDSAQVIYDLGPSLEDVVRSNQVQFTLVSSVVLFFIVLLSALLSKNEKVKSYLFWATVTVITINTFYLVSSTVYVNNNSISGGPVHHHADFEIYDCGTELDLIDPKGFSNKVGTPTLHEHNDKRIHVEGALFQPGDTSLGKFFNVQGGEITSTSMTLPTINGPVSLKNGDICNGETGMLQVFVYQTRGDTFKQMKLDDPARYVIAPEVNVPPGDCVIIEFDAPKPKTDKMCLSYKVNQQSGKIHGN